MFATGIGRTRLARIFLTISLLSTSSAFAQEAGIGARAREQIAALGPISGGRGVTKADQSAPSISRSPTRDNGAATDADRSDYAKIKLHSRKLHGASLSIGQIEMSQKFSNEHLADDLWEYDGKLRAAESIASLKSEFSARDSELNLDDNGEADKKIQRTRMWVIAAYYYSWRLMDTGDVTGGKEVLDRIANVLKPYGTSPPPALIIAYVRYYSLLSQHSWLTDNKTAQNEADAKEHAILKTIQSYPADYVLLARAKANDDWFLNSAGDGRDRADACQAYRTITMLKPNDASAWSGFVKCQIDSADKQVAGGQRKEAIADLEIALEDMQSLERRPGMGALELQLNEIRLINALAKNEQDPPLSHSAQAYKMLAAERFSAIFAGRPLWETNLWDTRNVYVDFDDLDDASFGNGLKPDELAEKKYLTFMKIATAVEPSRKEYPVSPSFAYVAIDSRTKAIDALKRVNRTREALAESDAAMAILHESPLIARLKGFDGDGEIECYFYKQRIDLLLGAGRGADAETTFRAMDASCGTWARKYPWDYYVRSPVLGASYAIGRMFYESGRYAEALPLLNYASDWGDKDSSLILTDMYRYGRGTAVDTKRADQIAVLASGQSLKRFTVPTDFSGTKFPFNVYLTEYARADCPVQTEPLTKPCVGYPGVEDQALWIDKARGGKLPQDVRDSFMKLDKIARENNISLPDLAVYALGEAQKDNGTPADKKQESSDKSAAKPVPVDVATLPLTERPPANYRGELRFADGTTAPGEWPLARVMPLIPDQGCAVWRLTFDAEQRRTMLRQEISIPNPAGQSSSTTTRKEVTSSDAPLNSGSTDGKYCFGSKSPVGRYKVQVYSKDKELFSQEFFVRALRDFPGYEQRLSARPRYRTLAESASEAVQQMKAVHFARNLRIIADKAGVAFYGYDVTSFRQADGPLGGKSWIFALWNGSVWEFASPENRAAFLRDPAHFVPEYGGLNALRMAGQKADSSAKWFPAIRNDKIYLLDSIKDRDAWLADDGKLTAAADARWQGLDNLVQDEPTGLGEKILELGPVPTVEDSRIGQVASQIAQQMKATHFARNTRILADKAGVAFFGFDVTSFRQADGPALGRPWIFALWNGAVWQFASPENRAAFLRDPAHFMPEYGGMNALRVAGQKTESSSKWFPAVKNDKVYMLLSAKDRDTWLADDGKLGAAADAKWSRFDDLVQDNTTKLGEGILTFGPVPTSEDVQTDQAATDIARQMKATHFARTTRLIVDQAGVALDGFDVTTFREAGGPYEGKPWIFALWNGAVWEFLSSENRAAFLRDPGSFLPEYGGVNALRMAGQKAESSSQWFPAIVKNKLYLLDTAKDRDTWLADDGKLAAAADGKWADINVLPPNNPGAFGRKILALTPVRTVDDEKTAQAASEVAREMKASHFVRNTRIIADKAGVAFFGIDVTSFRQGDKPKLGKPWIFALWNGSVWQFASPENRAAFLHDPARFVPEYGGLNALRLAGKKADTSSNWLPTIKNDKLYLLNAAADRDTWLADDGTLARAADTKWSTEDDLVQDDASSLGKEILALGPVPAAEDAKVAEAAREAVLQMKATQFARNTRIIADRAGVALFGFDVTTLRQVDGPQSGRPWIFTLSNGSIWQFASLENRAAFLRDPAHFIPEYGGSDAMDMAGRKTESESKWFPAVRKDKVYLLFSAKDRDAWLADDGKLVAAADAKWATEDDVSGGRPTRLGQAILALGPVPEAGAVETMRRALPARNHEVEEARKPGVSAADLAGDLGGRAWSYLLLNRPDDAMRDIEEALRLAPDLNWIRVNMADALLMRGKLKEALAVYTSVAGKTRLHSEALLCGDIRDDVGQLVYERLVDPSNARRVLAEVTCPAGRNN